MSDITTISVKPETKTKLDALRQYRRETYEDIILRLIAEKGGPAA